MTTRERSGDRSSQDGRGASDTSDPTSDHNQHASYLGLGSRLAAGPADALADTAFHYELAAAPYLARGLGLADMAHVASLIRGGVIAADVGRRVLAGLLAFHAEPGPLRLDPRLGDVYQNRSVTLRERLGDDAGVIHTGRARREATTIAWQIACRERIARAAGAVAGLLGALLEVAAAHRDAVMPDFTYLHHAHPTTLAHYLLGFAYGHARDLDRLDRAFALVNRSPAGSGSVNGTRLAIDRDYLGELLGFDGVVEHTRDAMWAPDMTIEPAAAATAVMVSADRLAEELQLWTTAEFGFVELSDAHCRTSVIMPHKKNPYGLAYIRGQAREQVGRLAGLVATQLTPTGQPDNRTFAYAALPEGLDRTSGCARLLADVLRGAVFDRERMAAAARSGYEYATDLCDHLVGALGLDNRSAHRVVGRAVRDALDVSGERDGGGGPVTAAGLVRAAEAVGVAVDASAPALAESAIAALREPENLIAARTGRGGAGEAPVTAMLDELRGALARAESRWLDCAAFAFEAAFLAHVRDIAEGHES